jgi:hypothetical protein
MAGGRGYAPAMHAKDAPAKGSTGPERFYGGAGPARDRRYPGIVTASDDVRAETERMLDVAGVRLTDQGRARVRAELSALDRRWTPDRRAEASRRFLDSIGT